MGSKTVYLDEVSDDLAETLMKEDRRSLSNLVQWLLLQETLRRKRSVDDGWNAVREYIANPEKMIAEAEPLEKVKRELGL